MNRSIRLPPEADGVVRLTLFDYSASRPSQSPSGSSIASPRES